MTSVDVRSPDGETSGSIELPADVFDAPANLALMHQVVVAQLAAARAGTHSTKTRGEVSGGGAKPYRQKGTGRARQGSTRAPQFEGGGIVHGPKPRDYSQRTPKKMKAAALRGALSDRARDGRLHVVSAFVTGDAPSTREARDVLNTVLADSVVNPGRSRRVLVVVDPADDMSWKSLRNVSSVHLLDAGQLNTYDVLVSDDVVFTEEALQAFMAAQLERRSRKRRGGNRPDLTTPLISGAIPSVAPAEGEGDVDVSLTKSSAADTAAKPAAQVSATAADVENHPYGVGSHVALDDDSAPKGHPIKGAAGAKRFVVPTSALYDETTADVWFASAEAAVDAGFSDAGGDE
ncbi:MAG: 50S ribosomal protein L4 [Geodermatophilaceae bacterium]|nr:50S ribosomal protein L4 [Geodermatophilaceae bacterium]MDQ3464927.1 50S ribosomal protein L4 [Actinomycetota bacterium]